MWQALLGTGHEVPRKAYLKTWYKIHMADLKPIHTAACLGDVEKVESILSREPYILNEKDWVHRTALHLASAKGHAEVVRLLVNRKCQLNRHDNKRRTALIKAVQCQEEECVTVLLRGGADPNFQDVYGNAALHYAAYHQNVPIAEKLLSGGAYIDPKNKSHLTPLLLAVSEKKEEMVDFLVKKGANINAVDKLKRSALELAKDSESSRIVSLLQQRRDVSSEVLLGQAAGDYAIASGFNNIPQQISEHKAEKIPKNPSENSNSVDGSAELQGLRPGKVEFWADVTRLSFLKMEGIRIINCS
ncbi:putative ankyrin repeat domain-containing protein 19 [Lemur catta]|uniref:putative ankyrin repeat domain-containing protein 19 n=1 Tax=Lemur catta TaxID=9447 RepID=UPI001E2674DF|nr:putative ankyrin repeat domain-containing protein 19 [Lemur catta]